MKKKIIRFLDCGANVGQSAEWANETLSGLGFSLRIDSFEANPELVQVIKDKNIPDTTVHHNAVAIEDSPKKFYLQNWGSKTGSSLTKFKESVIKTIGFFGRVAVQLPDEETDSGTSYYDLGYTLNACLRGEVATSGGDIFVPMNSATFLSLMKEGEIKNEELLYDSVDVNCINLLSWMENNIDFEKEFVILKLDIEGTEYEIATKLLSTGLYKKVDALLVEWTPMAKMQYAQEFQGRDKEVEACIRQTHEKFKFSWDWQHPEECRAPLLEYVEKTLNVKKRNFSG